MTTVAPPSPPPHSPDAPITPVTWWHYHRRLYEWMLTFAYRPWAAAALFLFSMAEAIFFPPPPDILQIPMTLERPDRAWYYAAINTVGSVVGGLIAFGLGYWMGPTIKQLFATLHLASEHDWAKLGEWTQSLGVLTAAAILFHPYKVFTIGCGILHRNADHAVPLGAFIAASFIGRGLRFFVVAALLRKFGAPVRVVVERYFHAVSIALVLLLIAGLFLLKFL
jgi:membrane protein YqaA with SNARE-associated domain